MTQPNAGDTAATLEALRTLLAAGLGLEAARLAGGAGPPPEGAAIEADWWHETGVALAQGGRAAEGAERILRALRLRPGTPLYLRNLARALADAGDAAGAAAAWSALAKALLPADPAGVAAAARAALALAPGDAFAEAHLAAGLFLSGERDEGLALARRLAPASDAPFEAAHFLANMLADLRRPEEALPHYDRAAELRPEHAPLWHDRAVSRVMLNDHEGAEADVDRALELAPGCPEYLWHKGMIRLALGDHARGWPLYEERLRHPGFEHAGRPLPVPLWDGAAPPSGRLLVWAEQGFGDTLMMLRFVPALAARGIEVVLEVQRELFGLVWQSLAGHPVQVVPRTDRPDQVEYLDGVSAHVPLMSLPARLGVRGEEDIPPPLPLVADPGRVARWGARLPEGRRVVGLSWSGRPTPQPERTVPAEALAPLFGVAGVAWVSLVKGPEEEALRALHPGLLAFGRERHDWAETAALGSCCDLVVTIDSAPAHLAGGLGVPCWTLLPHQAEWRWGRGRADTPWYPGMRLLRQPVRDDWESVVAEVATAMTGAVHDAVGR